MNFEKYIGIPYVEKGRDEKGLDCWGLVRLIYKNELSIDLPSFTADYDSSDTSRLEELFAQYKEGWESVESPSVADVVIFKIFGHESHIGFCIGNNHFLHVREGKDSVIESLDSAKWSKRVVGFFKYSEKSNAVLNTMPHPLKTQLYTIGIVPGTTVTELVKNINEQYNVASELKSRISVIINGKVIDQEKWSSTIISNSDVIEYRAVAGKSALKIVALVALIYFAPQLALSALGTVPGAYAASAIGQGLFLAAAQAGAMLIGSALINAIAPVRPPMQGSVNDPGSAERQLMVSGGANRANPYGAIPVVLGKVRMTPLLGSNNFLTYENERDSYLSMLLTWGYGPLSIDTNSFKIGDVPLSNFTDYLAITLDRKTEPTDEIKRSFDAIYGKDVTQVNTAVELVCEGNPQVNSRSITGVAENSTGVTRFVYGFRDDDGWVMGQQATIVFTIPTGHAGWTLSTNSLSNVVVVNNSSTVKTVTFNIDDVSGIATSSIYLDIAQENLSGSYVITAEGITPGPWFEAATTEPVNSCTVALHFPQGLRWIASKGDNAGSSYGVEVAFRLEYSTDNGENWLPLETTSIGDGSTDVIKGQGWIKNILSSFKVSSGTPKKDAFTYTLTYDNLNYDRMIVRVRRETGDNVEDNPDRRYYFQSILQNVTFLRNANPAVDPVGAKIAKTAFKIKATDQLNGNIQGINAVVQTWCKNWNGSDWVDGATSNPAALMRYVLEHPANPRRITDASSQINLTQLQHFHEYCTSRGFEYNGTLGQSRGVLEVIRDICAAGRASPALIDGKWTVVIDEIKSNVVQHFTPHNSWDFEGSKALPKRPDGLRVTYYDEDYDYQEAEIIVYDTGKNTDNASLFESITLPGVTKKSLVIDHAKWHMAQMKLRPEVYTLNSDSEYLVCNRGDRVKVMHDVPLWGLGSGRIKNRISNTQIELDEQVSMQANADYTIRFRSKTGASVVRQVVAKESDGYYSVIDLETSVTETEADAGDLFLFGQLNQESQDLMVISIEPSSNNSARLTLVDYGVTSEYNIFNDYLNLSESVVFESQITLPPSLQIESFGDNVPLLTSLISDESAMDIIAQIYNINLAYFNNSELPKTTQSVEVQYDLASSTDNVNIKSLFVNFEKGSAIIPNVSQGETYRIRLRYISSAGRSGLWSEWENHTVQGLGSNKNNVDSIEVTRVGRYLRVKATVASLPNTFKYFKVKIFKDQGSGDFWTSTDSSIITGLTQTDYIDFDLLDFASPRISESGTKYRVACRVVDVSGNESLSSAVGSITLKTILP